MPVYGFQINKNHPWHGGSEDIGNVYHYQFADADVSEDNFENLAVNIAQREGILFPTDISFLNAVVWGPTDGPEVDNVIVDTYNISFVTGGVAAEQGASQTTTAVFVAWPLPRTPTTNRKRRLGKYIRPAYGAVNDDGALSGRTAIPQTAQDYIREEYAAMLTEMTLDTGGAAQLCTSDGVTPNGGPYVKNYVTNRQISK